MNAIIEQMKQAGQSTLNDSDIELIGELIDSKLFQFKRELHTKMVTQAQILPFNRGAA